jgi:predicted RNase H-like HicB family nuclease
MKKAQVIFNVSLPYKVFKEGKSFISWCYPLDISSQGHTPEEAKKNLEQAVRMFLIGCVESGTLDKVLKNCGFIPASKLSHLNIKKSKDAEISVPLPFIINDQLARCQS